MKAQGTKANPFRFPCSHCRAPIAHAHIVVSIITAAGRRARHFCSRACAGTWFANAP
jgi:hypothetical protein